MVSVIFGVFFSFVTGVAAAPIEAIHPTVARLEVLRAGIESAGDGFAIAAADQLAEILGAESDPRVRMLVKPADQRPAGEMERWYVLQTIALAISKLHPGHDGELSLEALYLRAAGGEATPADLARFKTILGTLDERRFDASLRAADQVAEDGLNEFLRDATRAVLKDRSANAMRPPGLLCDSKFLAKYRE